MLKTQAREFLELATRTRFMRPCEHETHASCDGMISAGNMSLAETRRMFEQHMSDIVSALTTFTLVEIDRVRVSGVA